MGKTNAIRLAQLAGLCCREAFYEYDESDLGGMHAAQCLGMPPEQVFKTLVTRGDRHGITVFCIPVCCELNLKKAAECTGDKKIELVAVRELLGLTGYIRGGCSPIGMKKRYPTFFDETARPVFRNCCLRRRTWTPADHSSGTPGKLFRRNISRSYRINHR